MLRSKNKTPKLHRLLFYSYVWGLSDKRLLPQCDKTQSANVNMWFRRETSCTSARGTLQWFCPYDVATFAAVGLTFTIWTVAFCGCMSGISSLAKAALAFPRLAHYAFFICSLHPSQSGLLHFLDSEFFHKVLSWAGGLSQAKIIQYNTMQLYCQVTNAPGICHGVERTHPHTHTSH